MSSGMGKTCLHDDLSPRHVGDMSSGLGLNNLEEGPDSAGLFVPICQTSLKDVQAQIALLMHLDYIVLGTLLLLSIVLT